MYHVFYTHTMSYVLVICRMFKIIYNIIILLYYPLAELNQRMLNPSYRFPIY